MTLSSQRHFIAFMGPSGAGKTTLMRLAAEHHPDLCHIVRTLLSRPPRDPWEERFFNFVGSEIIHRLHKEGKLVHYEQIYGNIYALTKTQAELATNESIGLICLTEVGVQQLRKAGYAVSTILIVCDRDINDRGEHIRRETDEQRFQTPPQADLVLHNRTGELYKAVQQLDAFINSFRPVEARST